MTVSVPALRASTGIVIVLLGVSAVFIAAMTAVNWIQVIRLYEGLQVSFLGGVMVTAGQLAILPNLIVFGAAWLTGVGFQIQVICHCPRAQCCVFSIYQFGKRPCL